MDNQELILAGMDVEELLKRLMNNRALIPMFVKKFMDDPNFDRLTQAVAGEDWQGVEMASHTLKGMCGNLSLKPLYLLFQEQVRLVRSGEREKAAAMMPEIEREYRNTVTHLTNWLAQI